jgi:hypothetical protein
MSGQITDPKQALNFILGGKAFVTLVSQTSGNRYTYKITEADKRNPNDAPVYFVSLLNGPDNWSNYAYIGMIKNNLFAWTGKSKVSQEAPSFIGFDFCFKTLVAGNMRGFEVWHEGKCGRCGRKLTVPESIACGFGPECIGKVGMAAVAPVVASGAPAPQHNLNFDGSVRQPRAKKVAQPVVAAGVAAPAPVVANVGDMDAQIRERINEYKSEAPENYYQDGMLDEQTAFNVAYNMFRVKIQGGN